MKKQHSNLQRTLFFEKMKYQQTQTLTLGDFLTFETKEKVNRMNQKKVVPKVNMREKISQVQSFEDLGQFEGKDLRNFLSQKGAHVLNDEEKKIVADLRKQYSETWHDEERLTELFRQLKEYQETYDRLIKSVRERPGENPLDSPAWDFLDDGTRIKREILELRVWLNLTYGRHGVFGMHCTKN